MAGQKLRAINIIVRDINCFINLNVIADLASKKKA